MIRFTHMKKWLSIALFNFLAFATLAQEVASDTVETGLRRGYFTNNMKWTMVYIFGGVVILLVLRTFRNKPDV